MGYCMDQTDSDFTIKKENFTKALEALKAAFIPENMNVSDYINGKEYPHFSWVDTQTVLNAKELEDALREIRYQPVYDDDGNIINVEFTGEKAGAEDVFFVALAPYVENHSYICFEGEDGCRWEWDFDGQKVKEVYI